VRGLLIAVMLAAASCRPVPRVGSPCAAERAFAPFDAPRPAPPAEVHDHGLLDALVGLYQARGRAPTLPRGGCPFSPTCSHYAREALARYGPLAVVLIVDRLLVREHAFAPAYYPMICAGNTTRLSDEVP
jgi:putative component of membrane protein insertase Oxa1/YidC/SpoIIIJ protein YidD